MWTCILITNLFRKWRCLSPINYWRNHLSKNLLSIGIRFTTQRWDCKLFGTKSRHWAHTTTWYQNLAIIRCKRSTHKTLRSFTESKWTKKKEFKVNSRRKYLQIYWKLALHANTTLPLITRMARLINSNRKMKSRALRTRTAKSAKNLQERQRYVWIRMWPMGCSNKLKWRRNSSFFKS